MQLFEAIVTALSVLRTHRMRSFLTMLGIVIGIAGVIAMMSFGDGAKKLVMSEVERFGGVTNFGVYRPGWIKQGRDWVRNPGTEYLRFEDVGWFQEECPSVVVATPDIWMDGSFSREGNQLSTRMIAASKEFTEVRQRRVDIGNFLSDEDLGTWSKVCVLGSEVARKLFEHVNPVGRELTVNDQRFTVIGVMEEKGKGLNPGRGPDDEVIIPITTAQARFIGSDRIGGIVMRAENYEVVDQAIQEAKACLVRHHGDSEQFRVWSAKEGLEFADKISLYIKIPLGIIAAISLVVGGIGILNIMLVSVTERILEIGLRKAVGAKSHDVRVQFLIEAVILCTLGSLGGIILGAMLGYGFAWGVTRFVIKEFSWPSVLSLETVLLAVSSGVAIGLFFGYYPASKAAKLPPIEALRHE